MSGVRGMWVAVSVCLACGGGGGASTDATGESVGASDGEGPGTATSAASGADPSEGPVGGGEVCDGEVHSGEATYYAADGSGNCSFDANPGEPMVAAMNNVDYAASAACGACVAIDGPDGSITVRIVDSCPGCPQGDIDLSEGAFPMIAAMELGRVPISWRYVSCATSGPIVYHFKEGSNEWWTAVQIRGHKNPIATLEFKDAGGQWQAVPRLDYNYFVAEQGMGPGPYAFRVTDTAGNVLEDSGVSFVEAGDAPGAGQFPACE
ncbi:expansin EXLX1 family cellulose-binding protein [Nannocystis radixulma]|uniref:Expansin EXLX1 family cellulose-binding protein n=1 Tax=Nannocystis radixulma TaxID=2995305 RepID=A0ABT5AZW0_9BACT|nr:expansin EXLX1 family cellulose-binding protein [Nannocystis radixulma]MDC0666758.1 expansin EXLX1 family cellulose-binding protein [Nannocystis radixulma]